MSDPLAWRIDQETLRDEPVDREAMRRAVSALLEALPEEPVQRARRLGEAAPCLRMLGDPARAQEMLREALTLVPVREVRLRAALRTRLAVAVQWLGRYDEADRTFAELCADVPEELRDFVAQRWGKSLFEQGRHADALTLFSAALEARLARGDGQLAESTRIATARVEQVQRGARDPQAAASPR